MGSYNYLGFAENAAESLKTVADATLQYGVGVCSTRHEIGEFLFQMLVIYISIPFFFKRPISVSKVYFLWNFVQPLLCKAPAVTKWFYAFCTSAHQRISGISLHLSVHTCGQEQENPHIRNTGARSRRRGDANRPCSRRRPNASWSLGSVGLLCRLSDLFQGSSCKRFSLCSM